MSQNHVIWPWIKLLVFLALGIMKHDLKRRKDQEQTAAPVAPSSATLKPASHQENMFNRWVEKMNAAFQLWNTALTVYDCRQEQIDVIDKEAQKVKLRGLSVTGSLPGLLCMSLRRPFIRKSPLRDSNMERNNTQCLKRMLRTRRLKGAHKGRADAPLSKLRIRP